MIRPIFFTTFCGMLLSSAHAGDTVSPAMDDVSISRCGSMIQRSSALLEDDPVEALVQARNALAIAEKLGHDATELAALEALANAEERMGLGADLVRTLLRKLDVATGIVDPRAMAATLQELSDAYGALGRHDQAVTASQRALALLVPMNDRPASARAHLHLIGALVETGKYAEALSKATDAIRDAEKANDVVGRARVHLRIARIHLQQERYNDAVPFLVKAENVLNTSGTMEDLCDLAMDRCRIMLGVDDLKEARRALDAAEVLAQGLKGRSEMLMRLNYEYALAMQQWQSALIHLQRWKAYRDSLERQRLDMKLAGLQILYEVKDKDEENRQLRALNSSQADTIVEQRSNNRYLLISLLVVLILSIALFITSRHGYRMMKRLKRKSEVIRRQRDEIQEKVMELKRQNMRLAESLMGEEEKEVILKEIHHRVKNNLQVVESLLSIHSSGIDDPRFQRLLKDAQGRIRSMAMVHEHIYRSGTNEQAPLRPHLEKLARGVLVSHGVHDRISVTVKTDLPVFHIDTLLPLSLVVNELLTNSVKHAFRPEDTGHIKLSIMPSSVGYELRYTDDGSAVPTGMERTADESFGQELLHILARQLNGELKVVRGVGTVVVLTFLPDREQLRLTA